MKWIESEIKNQILHLRLQRPEKSNALLPEILQQLVEQVTAAPKDEKIRAICLSGAGENFCTGADLNWLLESPDDFSSFQKMYQALWECDLPLIARVQGRILGGGVGLVSLCDIVICQEGAEFSLPEARWGLIPGILTPFLIAKIGASRFLAKSLSGETFSARQALEWGLVHEVRPLPEMDKTVERICQSLCAQSAASLAKIKKTVRECQNLEPELIVRMAQASSEMKSRSEVKNKIGLFLQSRTARPKNTP